MAKMMTLTIGTLVMIMLTLVMTTMRVCWGTGSRLIFVIHTRTKERIVRRACISSVSMYCAESVGRWFSPSNRNLLKVEGREYGPLYKVADHSTVICSSVSFLSPTSNNNRIQRYNMDNKVGFLSCNTTFEEETNTLTSLGKPH